MTAPIPGRRYRVGDVEGVWVPDDSGHDWHVEDVAQGMVPRILCVKCGTEKPPLTGQP